MKIIVDSSPPRNAKLSAKYKRSFAYPSMAHRLPVILTKVIDYLSRDKAVITKCYGECAMEEVKEVIGEISQLKNHLQTSKQFEYFSSDDADTGVWNAHLNKKEELSECLNYFESDWLFAECYVYRRLREIFATKYFLKTLDPFSSQKSELLRISLPVVQSLFHYLFEKEILDATRVMELTQLQSEFCLLTKISLWGNRIDLSLKVDGEVSEDILNKITEWDEYLLVDDSPKIFSTLCSTDNSDKIVDIVTDNDGVEILCDLCLADLLVTRFHVKKVNFRVKPIPWFVSDVIPRDFQQVISSVACHHDEIYESMGKRWQKYLDTGVWAVLSDQYWCLGKTYPEMCVEDPFLYSELQASSLIIMKGDLNYRKLLSDINWEPTTPFSKVVGNFQPAPLIVLRTCKADLICGLKPGQAEKVSQKDPDWLTAGNYGIMQYNCNSDKVLRD
ncbi:damage-control phosphatase ARMT1-like isoform X2 [Rhodnius prolixus]|uniref:Sugar phosphate phosphatase n=2 Tax=Rhodnius prolixus TaxID=13249 RepID=R4G3P7_RHOPR